jgi:hypothetical protein
MKNYHLSPDGARWKLTREDDGTVLFFDNKEDAVAGCAEYMGEHAGSLKIHRADGSFEEERTYPRSADPLKTKG